MLTAALAALLLAAQPAVPPEQVALDQCLSGFVAAQQEAGTAVADAVNALATACYVEERAYRAAYLAAAAARGVRQLPADSEAHLQVLNLRSRYRDAFLATQGRCARNGRRS